MASSIGEVTMFSAMVSTSGGMNGDDLETLGRKCLSGERDRIRRRPEDGGVLDRVSLETNSAC